MAIDLVSFEELKSLLDLEREDISDYPQLEVLQSSVLPSFESFTQRKFELTKYTQKVMLDTPTRLIALDAIPVAEVISVTHVTKYSSETLSVYDYDETAAGLMLASSLKGGYLSVVYKGGFSEVPAEIGRAALLQVGFEYQNIEHIGASSVSMEGGSVTRPAIQLLAEVKRILQPYKHPARIL